MKKSFLLVMFVMLIAVVCFTGAAFADTSGNPEENDVIPDNGIPVVYLNIDESQGTIDDMIASPDHSVYCYGTIRIDVPEGFTYSDFPDTVLQDLDETGMQIRGRGNSTWLHAAKKPFKIKLDSKTDIFGMGKNKHWALLANAMDPTLIHNRITGWLGDELGFPFTPRGVPVDLVMTGSGDYGTRYLGSYYLSENVRVDDNRVEIQELKESDTDESVITGGYLLQNSLQVRADSPDRFMTSRGQGWATHTPSFDTEDDGYVNDVQQQYIQNYIQHFEDVLFDGTTAYRDLMDMDIAAKYWLVNQFSLNGDAFATGSTYIYKDRDVDGQVSKLYWGPLWDFDVAWHRTNYAGMDSAHKWMDPMFCDRSEGGFPDTIRKQWPAFKEAILKLIEDGGVIDQYYEETKSSAEQDYALYPSDETENGYYANVEDLKIWIRNRLEWMDANLDLLDDQAHLVRYIVDGEVYEMEFLDPYDEIDGSLPAPEKEGYVFKGWEDKDGFVIDYATRVTEDMDLKAWYIPEEDAILGEDIYFQKSSEVIKYALYAWQYDIPYTVLPENADDKNVTWTSSDESLATVNNKGRVIYTGPGEVTITASLKHGKTRTFDLKIIEGVPIVEPVSISPEEPEITVKANGQAGFTIKTDPDPATIDSYLYNIDDPNIALVDANGVIYGLEPGETNVRVTTTTTVDGREVTLETSAKVIVTGDDPEPEPEPVSVDNGIPVVYLNIDESQGTIDAMNDDVDHKTYCYGTITIDVPEGFRYSDFPDAALEDLNEMGMQIRGRGNSTWNIEKKPYKIKLDSKTDVLGLGKNKHWVLLANYMDSTLIKDRISGWLGEQMGFEFTPRGVPVDVIMTGSGEFGTKYLGSYYLSENVRVDKNRLEIDELEEDDTDPQVITGGYLLQNNSQIVKDSPDVFTTKNGEGWATHTPSFDTSDDGYENPQQQQYIQNWIQKVDDALFGDGYLNDDGDHYSDLMDVESAAKFWMVNAFTFNGDAYKTGSTYIYKTRDTEDAPGKLYWGPIWDFDYAWNYSGGAYEGFNADGIWEMAMLHDTEEGGFLDEVKKQWELMKPVLYEMIEDGGLIDKYCEETLASANEDRKLYPPEEPSEYIDDVEDLKTWIVNRIDWVDAHMSELDTFIHRVKYVSDGETFSVKFVRDGEHMPEAYKHPDKEGFLFEGWYDEDGNKISEETPVKKDAVLTAKFVSEEEATHGEEIALQRTSDIVQYNVNAHKYQIMYSVLPTDALYQAVEWSSSDEALATVDENGVVDFTGTGTVTITGKLKYGGSVEFTLTIVDEEPPIAEAIHPEKDSIELEVGQQAPFTIVTEPDPAKTSNLIYESSDDSIVQVDYMGIITAVAPGTAQVKVTSTMYDDTWEVIGSVEAVMTVTVKGDTPESGPEPEVAVYNIISGSDTTWTKNSSGDVTITIKRSENDDECFSHFTGVLIDGKALTRDRDYTAVKGSTIVTIKAATLESLSEGSHKVTITFDDGKVETELKIAPKEEKGANPKTGDTTNFMWFAVMLMAVSGLLVALKKR